MSKDQKVFLKQLQPPLLSAKIVALFRKGHIIFPLINRMLQYLVESGIVNKITERYDKLMIDKGNSLSTHEDLTLEHIAAPSFILVFGLVLGLIVFIWECKHYTRS
ncbi:hypothetical protein WA026_012138 [Henosepilachna vigintioctopunctata]|uniref:Uncharacterized protein n=1 Tax=Henosepilachna vigintioctopunctata TaxID=420089 RepID=A0AAW1V6A0_9CUCU